MFALTHPHNSEGQAWSPWNPFSDAILTWASPSSHRPANSHRQAQTGPVNSKADVGMVSGWESPASFKGTMSHVCERLCRTHSEAHTHFTQAFREGNDAAEWPVVHTATSGRKGPSITAARTASILAGYRLLRAGHPNCPCPQTSPQCILRSQGFPHWKSHKVPLASTSPWLLVRRRQKIPSPHSVPVAPAGGLQLFQSMPGLSPFERRREGCAEAPPEARRLL